MPILTFTDSQQFTVMEAPTPPPLPSPPYFIGQGLAEPCAPYPSEQVFGALLGTPQTAISQWPSNCEPVITTPTTAFDVSAIGPGHEVVVALYVIQGAGLRTGTTVTWDWYRDRDGALLFSLPLTIAAPPSGYWWAWAWVYSYIGYLYPGQLNQEGRPEIGENGYYHVVVTDSASGAVETIRFLVTGIPAGGAAGRAAGVPVHRKIAGGGAGGA